MTDYFARATDQMCMLAQLETRTAVEALEAIAGVEGFDGVFIGPSDPAASLGHAGNNAHPEVRRTVEVACRRPQAAGVPIGIVAPLEADARACLEMGFAYVAAGSDIVVLRRACDARQDVQERHADVNNCAVPGPSCGHQLPVASCQLAPPDRCGSAFAKAPADRRSLGEGWSPSSAPVN